MYTRIRVFCLSPQKDHFKYWLKQEPEFCNLFFSQLKHGKMT